MATRAQKAKVGTFLLMSAALVAGGAYFISQYGKGGEVHYVVEFTESVLGLSTGSPVVYQGMTVGTVENMLVEPGLDEDGNRVLLSHVDIAVNPAKVTLYQGVRAKLVMLSIATGSLTVYLAGGDPSMPPLPEHAVIPVEKSLLEAVSSRVEDVLDNVGEIAASLKRILAEVEPDDVRKIMKNADLVMENAKQATANLDSAIEGIRGDTEGGLKDLRDLINRVKDLADNTNVLIQNVTGKLEPVDVSVTQKKLNEVLDNVNALTNRLNAFSDTLSRATESVAHDAGNVEYGVREGLRSLTQTLDSLRELIEYLQQNPSALVRGKGTPKGE